MEANRQRFLNEYTESLYEVREKFPNEYVWPVEETERVANRIFNAFLNKTASNDGKAIKMTCKALGIKSTYKAIYEYLGVE